jgi:hypothetical protein
MGIFDGLGEAPLFGRGNYLNPGSYDIGILRVFPLDTRADGLATIAELDLKSAVFKPQDDPQGKGRIWQPTPAGTQGTWYQSMQDRNVALPALKNFMISVLGLREGDPRLDQWLGYVPGSERWPGNRTGRPVAILTSLMDHVCSDANVFQGLFVHVDCTMIKTKGKGGDFTRYDWSPLNFQALGLQPPNLDRFMALAQTMAPPVTPQQAQGFGPPGAPQGPPQGQGWGQAPQGYGQAPQGQGWGQPPAQAPQGYGQAPPQNGPPPGWGQPSPQAPQAPQWGAGGPPGQAPQAPPQGQPAYPPNWGPPQGTPPWGQS